MADSLQPPQSPSAPAPTSPSPKSVSFDDTPLPAATAAAATTASGTAASSSATAPRPQPKRRRSSLKQGLTMPYVPPKALYSHPDPLLRRLRLRDGFGKDVDLEREFRDTKLVLFFFGATWRGSSREPFDLLTTFARKHPHQCKVVYVSVDQTEAAFEANTRQKPWLAMEWNDGSNMSPPDDVPVEEEVPPAGSTPTSAPLEPFLLAGDPDLEEEVHVQDPAGSLYLRPYSRVYLADKWTILGVPNLVAYHVPSRKVLTYHARWELLKDHKADATWAKWSRGEKVEMTIGDFVHALRWSLGLAVVASAYAIAVRTGYMDDVVGDLSTKLTTNWLSSRQ
ncbi:thioredoxin family protein [Rhodotorula paludigena]|uniref:thioredoxin family protein n=1 Tax=Rhodotorula paludigena TaxID=86838 RepID=UPI0031808497